MKYYVGIDLGGTNIVAGVVNERGEILRKHGEKTNAGQPFEGLVRDLYDTACKVVELAGLHWEEISSVGLGCPSNVNRATGLLAHANNLGWHNVPLPAEMAKRFGETPVYIRNDADCAALGEVMAGAAKECGNALMITLGTGLGGGIILNRRIYNGADGMGAELGHTKLVYGGVRCTCGQYGCLESYASATALIRQTREAMAAHPESGMHRLVEGDLSRVEARTAFDAAKAGDETALAVVDQYTSYLAAGLSSFVCVFRPEIIVLGGGVSNAGDFLLGPVNEKLLPNTHAGAEIGVPPVVRAQLGNDAGVIGAAMLGLSEQGKV